MKRAAGRQLPVNMDQKCRVGQERQGTDSSPFCPAVHMPYNPKSTTDPGAGPAAESSSRAGEAEPLPLTIQHWR